MTFHLDVIRNDWPAGVQRRVARVELNGKLEVTEASQPDRWREYLLRPVQDPDKGEWIDPYESPQWFLEALGRLMGDGSYIFAVGPHEDSACRFLREPIVKMEPLSP